MIAGRPKSNVFTKIVAHCAVDPVSIQPSRTRRVEREPCSDGTTSYKLIFPTPGSAEAEDVLPFTDWALTPLLAEPFAEALLVLLSAAGPGTKRITLSTLRAGFGAFLATSIPTDRLACFDLAHITPALVSAFITWLNRPDPATGSALFSVNTRVHRLGVLRRVVEELRRGTWKERLAPNLRVPRHVWRSLARQTAPTPAIQHEKFACIYRACADDVRSVMADVEEGRRLIAASRGRVPVNPQSRTDYQDLGVCLAALDQIFPNVIPDMNKIRQVNPYLERAISRIHGGSDLIRYFYPSAQLLIPFILLLQVHLAYNPETVLGSTIQDYTIDEVLGVSRVRASAFKGRAGARQPRSVPATSDPDNPASILAFLDRWTKRLRDHAPPHQANRLFLFVQTKGRKSVKSFAHPHGAQADNCWSSNLLVFCKKHDIYFTPRQVRQTVLDTTHALTGGDLRAIMAVGVQRDPRVVLNHYTSDRARQDDTEALAAAMDLRQRDHKSAGRIDALRVAADGGDVGAATPGWICLDPYDSPLPDQTKGRLCQAYGRCPGCPLAQLDIESPLACVHAHDLLTRVDEAMERLPAEAWLSKWAPVRQALISKWLYRFSPKIRARAEALSVPCLPPVE